MPHVLKLSLRKAEVLRKTLWSRLRKPVEPIMVSDGSYRWRIDAEPLRRIVDEARREGLPYAVGRDRVRARVVALLQRQSEYRTGNSPTEGCRRLDDHAFLLRQPVQTDRNHALDARRDTQIVNRMSEGKVAPLTKKHAGLP